jgi:hypothetical protein
MLFRIKDPWKSGTSVHLTNNRLILFRPTTSFLGINRRIRSHGSFSEKLQPAVFEAISNSNVRDIEIADTVFHNNTIGVLCSLCLQRASFDDNTQRLGRGGRFHYHHHQRQQLVFILLRRRCLLLQQQIESMVQPVQFPTQSHVVSTKSRQAPSQLVAKLAIAAYHGGISIRTRRSKTTTTATAILRRSRLEIFVGTIGNRPGSPTVLRVCNATKCRVGTSVAGCRGLYHGQVCCWYYQGGTVAATGSGMLPDRSTAVRVGWCFPRDTDLGFGTRSSLVFVGGHDGVATYQGYFEFGIRQSDTDGSAQSRRPVSAYRGMKFQGENVSAVYSHPCHSSFLLAFCPTEIPLPRRFLSTMPVSCINGTLPWTVDLFGPRSIPLRPFKSLGRTSR